MKKQSCAVLLGAAFGMLILILDGKTAMAGAAEGLELCIRTLIPSLFPFFFLSSLLTSSLGGQNIPFLRPLGKLCHTPVGSESFLAVGFLGGYPVGAQNVAEAYRSGLLSRADASRMIAFCSNAGPSFLFGILSSLFSEFWMPWLLWVVHILSALIVGTIIPNGPSFSFAAKTTGHRSVTEALESSIKAMALVCGWVILFRMLLTFLNRWVLWIVPSAAQIMLSGILELSNGCILLSALPFEGLRFLIAAAVLGFGGICVAMQTASVVGDIPMTYYFPGKLLQGCISFLMASAVQPLFPSIHRFTPALWIIAMAGICAFVLGMILRKSEKRSSIQATVVV